MKKLIFYLVVLITLLTSTAFAKTAIIGPLIAPNGGGVGALDAVECEDIIGNDTNRPIATGDIAIQAGSDKVLRYYRYDSTGTDSEGDNGEYDPIVPDDRDVTYPASGDCAAGQWDLISPTGGILILRAAADSDGELGYIGGAYNLFVNSDSLTITNAADVWTVDSTGDTIAFTPSVAFNGGLAGLGDITVGTSMKIGTPAGNYTAISNTGAITQDGSATLTLQDGSDLIITANADDAPFLASAGDTLTGTITLDDDASIKIDATADGMADDKYNGITVVGKNFGETVAQWSCVFLASDGKYDISDADAAGEFPAWGIVVAGGDDTDPAILLTHGVVRNEGWTGLTVGGPVYLGDDGTGAITQVAPSTSGDCVQIVGFAISDSEIYFDFSRPYLELE